METSSFSVQIQFRSLFFSTLGDIDDKHLGNKHYTCMNITTRNTFTQHQLGKHNKTFTDAGVARAAWHRDAVSLVVRRTLNRLHTFDTQYDGATERGTAQYVLRPHGECPDH